MTDFEPKYVEYAEWHDAAKRSYLEPARLTAVRLLEELLDDRVDSVDRNRFRISTSRVKTAQRSFAKLGRAKYSGQVNDYEDVPQVLDDLVGLRLICNNLSDINTFQELVGELPIDADEQSSLAVERDSHRDYFTNPKASGYRAYHVNFVVPVPQMNGTRRVCVEVQARTLLQDGWGELTHEDTYKPGSTVPEWIVGMSLRMAELLAAVDNIAQDLRTGLDVETQRSVLAVDDGKKSPEVAFVAGTAESATPTSISIAAGLEPSAPKTSSEAQRRDAEELEAALVDETLRITRGLTKPVALAALSQQLNLIFGTEITRTWAKRGGFKKFLEATVPESRLSGPPPGYIHPPNTPVPDGWITEDAGKGAVPSIVRELRTYDKAIPLLGAERLEQVVTSVTNVLQEAELELQGSNATLSQLEGLAKQARSDAETRGTLVVRPHAAYVLQAVNRRSRISRDITASEVRGILFDRIITMAEANDLVEDRAVAGHELCEWLGIDV
ncbi:hypothetical protein [Microbacterium sp. LWH11-1.2]|uniref:GTP pyrophosphokinase n=1 Tax=Microbacterium sp. LWH11-1.2 TaxID=3135258 RepID=UPI0031386D0B